MSSTVAGTTAAAGANRLADEYGGVGEPMAPAGPGFTAAKIANRWVLLTPTGRAFWMLGVFNIDVTTSIDDLKDSYHNRVKRKYGDTSTTWARQVVRRLRSWGFNSSAEYANLYVLPFKTAAEDRIPTVSVIRPAGQGLINKDKYAPGPFKDLRAGFHARVAGQRYRGAGTPDIFDPHFDAYVDGWLRGTKKEPEWKHVLESPWIIGIATDDADDLVGFGPGPELPAPRIHDHIGWVTLVTNPAQKSNESLKVSYTDERVHSKYALRDGLKKRYQTIAELNQAWGSAYTTFDSDGGWPDGKGLLDESGRNRWVGADAGRLAGTAPRVAADLDEFLYVYAKHYFSVVARRIRQHAPGRLVFGPATLNGWGGLTRKEILRAAGEEVDILQAGIASQKALTLTARYAGDVPIVTWEGWPANADASLWRHPNPEAAVSAQNQAKRAGIYTAKAALLFDGATADGVKPVVGLKFWAWCDNWGEKANWGLVSFLDNAYDGKEAVRASGKDPWGYPTGGEERDYGDFISPVKAANDRLRAQLVDFSMRAPKNGRSRQLPR